MMTVETLIIKLGVNPKEISKAEIILLTSLVERYNHGYMRRSIYFSYEEVLIKEAMDYQKKSFGKTLKHLLIS
mgnify:CR=1 FL=1